MNLRNKSQKNRTILLQGELLPELYHLIVQFIANDPSVTLERLREFKSVSKQFKQYVNDAVLRTPRRIYSILAHLDFDQSIEFVQFFRTTRHYKNLNDKNGFYIQAKLWTKPGDPSLKKLATIPSPDDMVILVLTIKDVHQLDMDLLIEIIQSLNKRSIELSLHIGQLKKSYSSHFSKLFQEMVFATTNFDLDDLQNKDKDFYAEVLDLLIQQINEEKTNILTTKIFDETDGILQKFPTISWFINKKTLYHKYLSDVNDFCLKLSTFRKSHEIELKGLKTILDEEDSKAQEIERLEYFIFHIKLVAAFLKSEQLANSHKDPLFTTVQQALVSLLEEKEKFTGKYINLAGLNLTCLDLSNYHAHPMDLTTTNLESSSFRHLNLDCLLLHNAYMRGCDLSYASHHDGNPFNRTCLKDAKLKEIDFDNYNGTVFFERKDFKNPETLKIRLDELLVQKEGQCNKNKFCRQIAANIITELKTMRRDDADRAINLVDIALQHDLFKKRNRIKNKINQYAPTIFSAHKFHTAKQLLREFKRSLFNGQDQDDFHLVTLKL